MKKFWYSPLECTEGLEKLKVHGNSKGSSTGFSVVDPLYTMKSATTLYVSATPGSGKSEFLFELAHQGIRLHKWKIAIFSPESGTKEEIIAEMISKYLRKPFYKNVQGAISESEMYRAATELNEHIFIIDPGYNDITPVQFYQQVDEIERAHGKIHMTIIDPWNEMKHDFGRANRQDLYLEEMLGMIRRNAQERNRLNIIATHITDQPLLVEKGIRYYAPPTPREIAGGQSWYRKGMNMIALWRPPFGLADEEGAPYQENEVHVIVQKYKPKGVGKRGTAKLFFCKEANRFYQLNEHGGREFPGAK